MVSTILEDITEEQNFKKKYKTYISLIIPDLNFTSATLLVTQKLVIQFFYLTFNCAKFKKPEYIHQSANIKSWLL